MTIETQANACVVCGSLQTQAAVELTNVPIHANVPQPSQPEALSVARGDIALRFCAACGHLFNSRFEATRVRYATGYENALEFSPRFRRYARALAGELTTRFALRQKTVVELGCGRGFFLKLLCELGAKRGVGFDPGGPQGQVQESTKVELIHDAQEADTEIGAADFLCCRHVLEHIDRPIQFLNDLSNRLKAGTPVYFETPNALFTLRGLGIWDLIYEHRSYFSPESLSRAMQRAGFTVERIRETYEGQFLRVEARSTSGAVPPAPSTSPSPLGGWVEPFAADFRRKLQVWNARLTDWAEQDAQGVVWGAGSKGVTFLNAVQAADSIRFAVDVNPHKQGMYVAGSGQQIVPPDVLATQRPHHVIVMNPAYQTEIRSQAEPFNLSCQWHLA